MQLEQHSLALLSLSFYCCYYYCFVAQKEGYLLLVGEQYCKRESPLRFANHFGTAAIRVLEPMKLRVQSRESFVWIKCEGVTFHTQPGCYLTPHERIRKFQNKIDRVENEILTKEGSIVIAGDFNARRA